MFRILDNAMINSLMSMFIVIVVIFFDSAYLQEQAIQDYDEILEERNWMRHHKNRYCGLLGGGSANTSAINATAPINTTHINTTHGSPTDVSSNVMVIPSTIQHNATIIFLHGTGDTEQNWAERFKEIRMPYIKIVCPIAKPLPLTKNEGRLTSSWFDVVNDKNPYTEEDVGGINRSSEYVKKLIQSEIDSGVPSERIILGGFSQGGALALHSALTFPKKLGGVFTMNSWVPMYNKLRSSLNPANKDISVLQGNVENDPEVNFEYGKISQSVLKDAKLNVEMKMYEGEKHVLPPEGFDDIKDFLYTHLAPK